MTGADIPARSAFPAVTADKPRIAPTEMSIPPARMTNVIPRDPISSMELLTNTSLRFLQVKKEGTARRKMIMRTAVKKMRLALRGETSERNSDLKGCVPQVL